MYGGGYDLREHVNQRYYFANSIIWFFVGGLSLDSGNMLLSLDLLCHDTFPAFTISVPCWMNSVSQWTVTPSLVDSGQNKSN